MANYINLKSGDVKVYPSSQRSDTYDRNAKLTTEQNLISLINRLTGQDSFVISGLNIDDTGKNLKSGSCNIHGYLFNIVNDISLTTINKQQIQTGQWLYLGITLKVTSMGNSTYQELSATDYNNIINGTAITKNFEDETSFNGLLIFVQNANYTPTNNNTYILPLAQWNGSKWETLYSNDSSNKNNRWNTQKFNAKDILVEAESNSANVGSYYSEKQDLLTWLQYNFILDDGEIK